MLPICCLCKPATVIQDENMSVLCLQLVFSAPSWPKKLSKGGQRDGKEPQQDDIWGK